MSVESDMFIKNCKNIILRTLVLISAITILTPSLTTGIVALGDELPNRSIYLVDSKAGVITTHTLQFDNNSADLVGSVVFEYCDNSPIEGTVCNPPSGMDISSAVIDSQLGETGFSVHPSTTSTRLILTRIPAIVTPGTSAYQFSNVTNPTTPDVSYYVRVATFTSDDGTGSRLDFGGLAFALNSGLSVSAYVPPWLLFCVGNTITAYDCGTATGNNLNFGVLASNNTATAVSQFVGGTNGTGGYIVSVSGTTMTSGNNVIPTIGSAKVSQQGVSQFGINLRQNTAPVVGVNVVGPGSSIATNNYNQQNRFSFNTNDTISAVFLPDNYTKFTVSYIVNISNAQKPGIYTTTLLYTALATY